MKNIDDLKVIIINSESDYFKEGEELGFKEANELFEKAEKEIRKLKEEVEYGYDKVRAIIETPEGERFGFGYDVGDGYAVDLMDFCSKEFPISTLNEYLVKDKRELKEGDLILDKENSIKLITAIANEAYECFKLKSGFNKKVTDLRLNEGDEYSKVIDLSTRYSIKRNDVKNFVGQLTEKQLERVQKHKNLFKQKGLIKEFKYKPEVGLKNKLDNGLDFSMK